MHSFNSNALIIVFNMSPKSLKTCLPKHSGPQICRTLLNNHFQAACGWLNYIFSYSYYISKFLISILILCFTAFSVLLTLTITLFTLILGELAGFIILWGEYLLDDIVKLKVTSFHQYVTIAY